MSRGYPHHVYHGVAFLEKGRRGLERIHRLSKVTQSSQGRASMGFRIDSRAPLCSIMCIIILTFPRYTAVRGTCMAPAPQSLCLPPERTHGKHFACFLDHSHTGRAALSIFLAWKPGQRHSEHSALRVSSKACARGPEGGPVWVPGVWGQKGCGKELGEQLLPPCH